MKQLYLNNKRVVLNPDTYFPFTQKVSVLDDFTIIGMPASKTVTLPRCQENDEIFGYIAEITRIVSANSDNLIGVSFNQIRKVSYKLYSNSDIISEGIIRIVNITNDGYEIELYDKVIDLIETFSNEDGYLSELELILAGGNYLGYCNAQTIKTLSDANGELKVLANINTDETFDNAVVFTTALTRATLPSPLTKLQFGTLKPYDFEYAVPLSTIVRSINWSFNDSIEMDATVSTLFDGVHMMLGSPRAEKESIIYTCPSNAIGASFGNTSGLSNPSTPLEFKNTSGSWIGTKNGTYQMNLPFTLTFYPDTTPEYWGSRKDRPTSALIGAMPDGTYYGDLTVDVYLASYDGGTLKHTGVKSTMNIKMVQGDNTEWESTGGDVTKLTVSGYFPFTTEYYPELTDPSYNTYIIVNISRLFSSPSAFLPFYGFGSGEDFTIIKTIDESYKVNFNNKGDVRSGIIVSGQNLFPKVTIRDFLIKAAKYFNLGISNNGGKILLNKKAYSISPDTLLVDDITGLEVNNFDFSRLILKTKQPTSSIVTEYVENTKRNWAEQVINTGYKIKTSKKEIDFGVGIPVLLNDFNAYGYGSFGSYNNSGYSRVNNGLTIGLKDDINFCYIQKNSQPLWVANDSLYEAGMVTGVTQVNFGLYNEKVKYSGGVFIQPVDDIGTGSRQLESYYTASPYTIVDGVITKSLDLNKPEYNFANIPDVNYPESTTVYQTYHKKLVQDIYNVNTHIIDAKIWIDNVIDIYRVYNYRNTNYVISEISEYDPTEAGIYQVKLMRVNNITNYIY